MEVQGDRLVWWLTVGKSLGEEVDAPADLLLRFVRLANATPQPICNFASSWGPLNICEHGLPDSHNPPPLALGGYNGHQWWCRWRGYHNRRAGKKDGDGWEPLAAWRLFAGQARAHLNIAAKLHNGKLGDASDWQMIYTQAGRTTPWWKSIGDDAGLALERRKLADCVNEWLLIGNVRPALTWGWGENRNSKVTLQGAGLFGALAVQLLMAVSRTAGLAICSSCGGPYAPQRRPRADRRNYCPDCGIKAAWRDAQRGRPRAKPRKKERNAKASLSR